MDRLTQLRGEAGGSQDSTLDSSAAASEAYMTANESSIYVSLSEEDPSFDISPIKDVSLASTVSPEKPGNDQMMSNISPIANKTDLLDSFKFEKQIEAANILSGGVDIFDDNDNSYDGNELVIDDNVETDDKSNPDLKLIENSELPFQKTEELVEALDQESAIASKDTEVVLQIDGKSVNAINIGNGLYLYRKAGEEELAAVQIMAEDQDQPTFKFLKVRENAEGNLEVYEEIEIEVPKQVPVKGGKTNDKGASHVPIKGINKVINDPLSNKVVERKNPSSEVVPTASTSKTGDSANIAPSDTKSEVNLNGKMVKFNETRKSPVIHSTPNKEGIPLTKTMVDQQLHPNRHLDNVKTIEVHTDISKQRLADSKSKDIPDDNKPANIISKEKEKPVKVAKHCEENKNNESKTTEISKPEPSKTECNSTKTTVAEATKIIIEETQTEATTPNTELFTTKTENPDSKPCEESEIKLTSKSETKLENKPIKTNETKQSPVVERKLTKGPLSDATEALVPNPKETSQFKANETSQVKPIEMSQTKSVGNVEGEKSIECEIPSKVCKKPLENVTTESELENITEIALPKKISVESEASLKFKPTEKSEVVQAEDSKLINTLINEMEVEKTSDTLMKNHLKPKENITVTEEKNLITDTLPVESNESSKIKSDLTSSDIIPNDVKNDEQNTTAVVDANSKILENQSKQILPQNQQPKSIVVPDMIQRQVKLSSPPEVKIEQKPKEDPKILEKAKEPLQKMPIFEKNSPVSLVTPKNNSTTNVNITLKNVSDQKVKIVENIILVPIPRNETIEHKPLDIITSKNVKTETKLAVSDKCDQNATPERNTISESKATVCPEKPLQILKNQDKQVEQNVPQSTFNSTKSAPKQENIQNLKQEVPKPQPIPLKIEIVNKPDVKNETIKHIVLDKKPINNNNAAVPFGKWTEANRQEFLNKIKEAKIPANTSNTKQIKQANDLNRRDVLQKIDSQRQSNNALSKAHEPVKSEVTFVHKPTMSNTTLAFRDIKASVKAEAPAPKTKPLLLKKPEKTDTAQTSKVQTNLTVTSSYMLKSEGPQRNEFNNQDLIDKTIEGIINRVVAGKPQDLKQNIPKEQIYPQKETAFAVNLKPKEKHPSMLSDAIEMKMNELHGIPFVERPPHQLPRVYNRDVKTYSKSDNTNSSPNKPSNIPSLLPVAAPSQPKPVNVKDSIIDLDSEDEVIEHEPVTGDIDLHKNLATSKPVTIVPTAAHNIPHNADLSKKDSIITEKDFDKFYRRNSVTYSSDLYPNTKITSSTAIDLGANKITSQMAIQKPSYASMPTSKIQITSKLVPVSEEVFGKNYPSKLQMAYQSALSTKRQMDPPITIIEDKPVKVVFMDSNTEYPSVQLNVQGQQLSPSKKPIHPQTPEPDSVTTSTCDSLDSDILDSVDGKVPDEAKAKTKHQRKQVLTPVEAPELELIAPSDLGIEVSPKKKRRAEENKQDKHSKSVVPKKTYLLGRNVTAEAHVPQNLTKDIPNETAPVNSLIIGRSDAASAIDNLVKAAALLETQSASFKPESLSSSNPDSPQMATSTPVKRGRGRPRKYPLPDGTPDKTKAPSPQKKPRLIDARQMKRISSSDDDYSSSDDIIVKENWTMGKINENIVCPICSKLFRSENVVFKHVKHCTGPSPNRSDSDKHSPRRSRYSRDSHSVDSKFDDTDGDSDKPLKNSTPKKQKPKELSPDRKEDVIVIEDTPVKEKKEEPKQHEPRKPTKTKAQYKVSGLSCEHCGKTFRQLSYLVSHKLLHKKTNPKVPENEPQAADKNVFSCEVCKKEFRKLHHLVQHRIIHNPSSAPSRPSRKSSAEQSLENKATKEQEAKQNDDQSAAFRCEPCDKSFRKLHHLVEHRETHDGINRQKNISTTQSIPEKPVAEPPPQCDICKKTFRKLHHLSEHKEQHMDLSSEKSDEKGAKSALSTRDIIHECSLCYMVFPNEHSLNKHFVNCQKKKRQSAAKQAKQAEAIEAVKNKETPQKVESVAVLPPTSPKPKENIVTETPEDVEKAKPKDVIPEKIEEVAEAKQKRISKEQDIKTTDQSLPPSNKASKRDLEEPPRSIEKPIEHLPEVPLKVKKTEENTKEVKETEPPKKKTPLKEREQPTTAKRRKSNLPLARIKEAAAVESSDDDDIRYMLNPDYKDPKAEPDGATSQGKLFMKVRSNKRNSLQFDRPKSKDLAKRRTSLQNLSKVARKSKSTENTPVDVPNSTHTAVPEAGPATDSDDSDVKYSFPVKPQKPADPEKAVKTPKAQTPKEKRKSLVEKRKTLSGVARRKSVGKAASVKHIEKVAPTKEIKKRRGEVEHRCDCGELFSSGALLARHATLAHTPPRHRRRRRPDSPPAQQPAPAPPLPPPTKSNDPKKPTDKTTTTPRKKAGRPPGKTPPVRKSIKPESSAAKTVRKSVAHRGVPVPEKMKKIMEKLKK